VHVRKEGAEVAEPFNLASFHRTLTRERLRRGESEEKGILARGLAGRSAGTAAHDWPGAVTSFVNVWACCTLVGHGCRQDDVPRKPPVGVPDGPGVFLWYIRF
jgi:hypothetical protein